MKKVFKWQQQTILNQHSSTYTTPERVTYTEVVQNMPNQNEPRAKQEPNKKDKEQAPNNYYQQNPIIITNPLGDHGAHRIMGITTKATMEVGKIGVQKSKTLATESIQHTRSLWRKK